MGEVNLLRKLLLFLMLLAPLASAFQLQTGADSLQLSDSGGKLYTWFVNDGNQSVHVLMSARTGELNAYFDTVSFDVAPGEIGGTWLHLDTAACYEGVDTVTINAVWSVGNQTGVVSKTVQVRFDPSPDCRQTSTEGSKDAMKSSPKGIVDTATSSAHFSSNSYEVAITSPRECVAVKRGEQVTFRPTITNWGPTGDFSLSMTADPSLGALANPGYLDLYRSESQYLEVTFDISNTADTGRNWATLKAMHGHTVAGEADWCLDVQDSYTGTIEVPESALTATTCGQITLPLKVTNTGTAADLYKITASAGRLSMDNAYLQPGETAELTLSIDGTVLAPGDHQIEVTGESKEVIGSQVLKLHVDPCPAKPKVDASQNQTGNLFQLVISADNPYGEPLTNVTVDVSGLPADWKVLQGPATEIAPGDNATISTWIQPTSEQDADALITVKSGDQILGSTVEQIKPPKSGIASQASGFATAAFGQALPITLVVILAIVAGMYAYSKRALKAKDKAKKEAKKKRESSLQEVEIPDVLAGDLAFVE